MHEAIDSIPDGNGIGNSHSVRDPCLDLVKHSLVLELCDNGKSYISIMEDNLNKIISINNIISIMSLHDYLQDFRLLLYLSVSHSHSHQATNYCYYRTALFSTYNSQNSRLMFYLLTAQVKLS